MATGRFLQPPQRREPDKDAITMRSWRDLVATAWRARRERFAGLEIRAAPGLHQAACDLLRPYIPPDLRVLDLAAGTGAFLARLRTAGIRSAEAVDLDVSGFGLRDVPVHQVDLDSDFVARSTVRAISSNRSAAC
jgi:SAM-dependent methyltransferase